MTIKQIVKEICKREGLKSQTSIGNVREIVGHLSDLIADKYAEVVLPLYKNGLKRHQKAKKKK